MEEELFKVAQKMSRSLPHRQRDVGVLGEQLSQDQEEEQQWEGMRWAGAEQGRRECLEWGELTRLDCQGFIVCAQESELHPEGEGGRH